MIVKVGSMFGSGAWYKAAIFFSLLIPVALRPSRMVLVVHALSTPPPPSHDDRGFTNQGSWISTRRDLLWKVPFGVGVTYSYQKLLVHAFDSFGNIVYPLEHENRVSSTIALALTNAAASRNKNDKSSSLRPLRVLEVGIGKDARLIRRGLYDTAIHQLVKDGSGGVTQFGLDLTGLDFRLPNESILHQVDVKLRQVADDVCVPINFQIVDGGIASQQLPWSDETFDSIVCCLTLCSVEDPEDALLGIQRLLRPGGTLGYIEHVAVSDEEYDKHGFLAIQQQLLDPLQQNLADNCHLHRSTEASIDAVLGVERSRARVLERERFYVNAMWPVSCQSCGVIQKIE